MQRGRGRVQLVGLIVAVLGLATVQAAVASNYAGSSCNPPNDICKPNNDVHWFAYHPTFGPNDIAAMEYVRTGDLETTDMVTSNHGVQSDSTSWDVYSLKVSTSQMIIPSADGQVQCYSWSDPAPGQRVCHHWHLQFNVDYVKNYNVGTLRMLACHEMGHSAGLEHVNTTNHDKYRFMEMHTADRQHWSLGPHNRGHINCRCGNP